MTTFKTFAVNNAVYSKNSEHFMNLRALHNDNNNGIIVSFDVASFFTNFSIQNTIKKHDVDNYVTLFSGLALKRRM